VKVLNFCNLRAGADVRLQPPAPPSRWTASPWSASADEPSSSLGTILIREWNGQPHRVVVLDIGSAWNRKTYESLSKIAFANGMKKPRSSLLALMPK
jgi:hypothetical protein